MTLSIVKSESRVADNDIVSYGNYIGGRNVVGDEWIYALSPRAVLDDAFASLALKRKLEQGDITPAEAPPGVVVGRVAVADNATISAAMTAAAAGQALFERPHRWSSQLLVPDRLAATTIGSLRFNINSAERPDTATRQYRKKNDRSAILSG